MILYNIIYYTYVIIYIIDIDWNIPGMHEICHIIVFYMNTKSVVKMFQPWDNILCPYIL